MKRRRMFSLIGSALTLVVFYPGSYASGSRISNIESSAVQGALQTFIELVRPEALWGLTAVLAVCLVLWGTVFVLSRREA